jgi:hypothetical protein
MHNIYHRLLFVVIVALLMGLFTVQGFLGEDQKASDCRPDEMYDAQNRRCYKP